MKTSYRIFIMMIGVFCAISSSASKSSPAMMLPVHVVFSAKAYWDGPSKSCIPREKGGCCHIWLEGMVPGPGEIKGELVMGRGNVLQFNVSRGKGMNNETYRKFFLDGKFILDGPVTFEPDVLYKVGADKDYAVPAGVYPVAVNGDIVTITFK